MRGLFRRSATATARRDTSGLRPDPAFDTHSERRAAGFHPGHRAPRQRRAAVLRRPAIPAGPAKSQP